MKLLDVLSYIQSQKSNMYEYAYMYYHVRSGGDRYKWQGLHRSFDHDHTYVDITSLVTLHRIESVVLPSSVKESLESVTTHLIQLKTSNGTYYIEVYAKLLEIQKLVYETNQILIKGGISE